MRWVLLRKEYTRSKLKKNLAILLKTDLIKAYDKIDWGFLHLLLLHVGMDFEMVAWVMAYVSNVNFAILVNGSPTGFFKGHTGFRQGCPLSPLLFMVVIDGLSRMIGEAKRSGAIHGV